VLKTVAEPEQLEHCVRRLPATETAFVCAKLNLVFSFAMRNDQSAINQTEIVRWLCEEGWLSVSDRNTLIAHIAESPGSFLFARQSLLELVRFVSLWGDTQTSFAYNDVKRQEAFARALLICGELSTRTQKTILRSGKMDRKDSDTLHFASLPIFRECSLLQVPPFDPLFSLARFKELFLDCFLSKNPDYVPILEEELGLSIDDYIACLVGYGSIVATWSARGFGFNLRREFEFRIADPGEALRMSQQLQKFLKHEGQTITEFRNGFGWKNSEASSALDLRVLREKPVLLSDDGRATVIDEALFMERASAGLLFQLARKIGDEALENFGYAFEEFAREKLMRYVKMLKANSLDSEGFGPVKATEAGELREFTDFILVEGTTLVIFEMKEVWPPDSIISSNNYWSEMMKRYGLSKSEKGRDKRKGVAQLAECIKKFLDNELEIDPSVKIPKTVNQIIPVLFVHDTHLSTLSHGKFLSNEFARLLFSPDSVVPQAMMRYNEVSIVNLCVVTIDEFEHFDYKISSKQFSTLLTEYSEHYRDRVVSAGRYLANLAAEDKDAEPHIVAVRNAIVDQASLKLFGRVPPR